MVDQGELYDVMRQGLWVAFSISLPILSVALIVGIVIGLFQALTSIQELTLTFVPKLAAIAVTYWITMGFMTERLVSFFQGQLLEKIIGG